MMWFKSNASETTRVVVRDDENMPHEFACEPFGAVEVPDSLAHGMFGPGRRLIVACWEQCTAPAAKPEPVVVAEPEPKVEEKRKGR